MNNRFGRWVLVFICCEYPRVSDKILISSLTNSHWLSRDDSRMNSKYSLKIDYINLLNWKLESSEFQMIQRFCSAATRLVFFGLSSTQLRQLLIYSHFSVILSRYAKFGVMTFGNHLDWKRIGNGWETESENTTGVDRNSIQRIPCFISISNEHAHHRHVQMSLFFIMTVSVSCCCNWEKSTWLVCRETNEIVLQNDSENHWILIAASISNVTQSDNSPQYSTNSQKQIPWIFIKRSAVWARQTVKNNRSIFHTLRTITLWISTISIGQCARIENVYHYHIFDVFI